MAIVGYWRFNGNSNDASGSGYNGTGANITYSQANGVLNGGAGFNGINSVITLGAKIVPLGAKTISFLLYPKQAVDSIIFDGSSRSSSSKGDSITYHGIEANKVTWHNFKGTTGTANFKIDTGSTLDVNKWYHLVLAWDGTTNAGGVKLYLNGKLEATAQALATESTANSFNTVFGRNADAGATTKNFANVNLDDFKMSNTGWSNAAAKNEYSRIKGFYAN